MPKQQTFQSVEFCFFDEEHQMWVAVSMSFDLVAEASSQREAMSRLREATIAYLLLCIQDNEPKERVYRAPSKELIHLFENTLKESLPSKAGKPRVPNRRYVSRHRSYGPRELAAV